VVLCSLGGLIGIMIALVALWHWPSLKVPFILNAPIIFVAFLLSAALDETFKKAPESNKKLGHQKEFGP
jgi:MFS family permease